MSTTLAAEFLAAATVPVNASHMSGTLDRAAALLAANPALATHDIHVAAALGDDAAVRGWIARDAANATARGPLGWDPLTTLCFSRYLRLDRARAAGFLAAAEALLDAGADANGGWHSEADDQWESVLYGAAGLAHDAALTRLLLARGADPNDGETPYHAAEARDLGALHALLDSGRLDAENLTLMLLRKADVHDHEGMRLLLERGADPRRATRWSPSALHHAVRRDNALATCALLLDHGADPVADGVPLAPSAAALAARRGRGDLLAMFAQRGFRGALEGADALLAVCARGDAEGARRLLDGDDALRRFVREDAGAALAEFAGNGNVEGVRCLLDAGVPVDAAYEAGDGYFEVAPRSTALHVAAWRAQHDVVRLLLRHGADVQARDGRGRTALVLAVRACVDSYWTARRRPDSVAALLAAGASARDIPVASGYDAIDVLLDAAR